MALTLETSARNASADAIAALFDVGTAALGGGVLLKDSTTLLVTLILSDPAFGAASVGVATMDNTPEPENTAVAAGDADVSEFVNRDGTLFMSGSAGTSGAEVNLDNVSIAIGQTVKLTDGTLTMPAS